MRRFELVEGKSSKFWEVDTQGNTLTTRFGRIGTNGQTQTKEFADNAAADKEQNKLIREKTGKGYTETTVSAGATLAAVAPKNVDDKAREPVATTATTEAPLAAPSNKPVQLPADTPAEALAPEALPWPDGGFVGSQKADNPRFVAVCGEVDLPIVRGFHWLPFHKQLSLMTNLPVFDEDKYGHCDVNLQRLAQGCGRSWKFWQRTGSKEQLTRSNLMAGAPEWWLEATAQCLTNGSYRGDTGKWLVQVGIAVHGAVFMLDILLKLFRAFPNFHGLPGTLSILRHAIAAADEAEYASAFALADAVRDETTLPALAYLFPHHRPWVDEALSLVKQDTYRLLMDCVMSVEQMIGYWRKTDYFPYYGSSGILLQITLHGVEAMPFLADMLAHAKDKSDTEHALAWIEALRCPGQISTLVKHMENAKETRAALDRMAEAFPAATLYTAIGEWHKRPSRMLEGWTLRLAARQDAALAQALAALPAAPAAAWREVMAALNQEEATVDTLPSLLREPPWMRNIRPQALPTLELSLLPTPPTLTWQAGEEALHKQYHPHQYLSGHLDDEIKKRKAHPLARKFAGDKAMLGDLALLFCYEIKDEALETILAGRPIQAANLIENRWVWQRSPDYLPLASPALRLNVWNSFPAHIWAGYRDYRTVVNWLLAEHGLDALPGFIAYAQSHTEDGLAWALPVDAPELASLALHALRNLKKSKDAAQRWIITHPRTTAIVALKEAFGKDKAGRDNGAFGLRWLMRQGQEAMIDAIAAEYDTTAGMDVSAALVALKCADPLNVLPAKMPKLPLFFSPATFRRPLLKDGRALPLTAVEHIGTMLTISKLEAPYPGIDIVRETCTPDSLAEFAWDLFEAWLTAGAPAKENWAFHALGLLGDNATVHRLTPKIREWPGESAHARAVAGLDILNAIGTDLALMSLNAIANKVKFKGLQEKAREKIAAIAEARGLSTDELADRLVPDLGLDAHSVLTLDFGPRQFTVAFDETLKPFIKDALGTRLKDLPKPIRSDDAEKSAAACERYKTLKKDAKVIASTQVTRLELAMVGQRRWSKTDFELFFLNHPVMRFLAARLVWGIYADGAFVESFRVAEDWTLADADDALYALPETASIGIAHVLTMPGEAQTAFGQIFADYEILQPFRQLGRETYTLTADELLSNKITRFAQKTVATGSVMGLINRGWERGDAQDGGWVGDFIKPLGTGLCAVANLDPGTVVGDFSYEPSQRITEITVHTVSENHWNWGDPLPLSSLDPVMASELLRDIDILPVYQK
jgi:predicted DNA-binding WGR domain protein